MIDDETLEALINIWGFVKYGLVFWLMSLIYSTIDNMSYDFNFSFIFFLMGCGLGLFFTKILPMIKKENK